MILNHTVNNKILRINRRYTNRLKRVYCRYTFLVEFILVIVLHYITVQSGHYFILLSIETINLTVDLQLISHGAPLRMLHHSIGYHIIVSCRYLFECFPHFCHSRIFVATNKVLHAKDLVKFTSEVGLIEGSIQIVA
jgi:hypothetical protein